MDIRHQLRSNGFAINPIISLQFGWTAWERDDPDRPNKVVGYLVPPASDADSIQAVCYIRTADSTVPAARYREYIDRLTITAS